MAAKRTAKSASGYTPITPIEVSDILKLWDGDADDDITGEELAAKLLSGEEPFEPQEVEKIAACLGLSVYELAALDKRFERYIDKEAYMRVEIARRLVASNMSAEFAAEVCGIDADALKGPKGRA